MTQHISNDYDKTFINASSLNQATSFFSNLALTLIEMVAQLFGFSSGTFSTIQSYFGNITYTETITEE